MRHEPRIDRARASGSGRCGQRGAVSPQRGRARRGVLRLPRDDGRRRRELPRERPVLGHELPRDVRVERDPLLGGRRARRNDLPHQPNRAPRGRRGRGGLVADGVYPQTSVPVEYLFGCGCSVPSDLTTCAVSTAGLDVQLACYASALRTSLDEIAVSGETAGGWGPGVPSVSLDGVTVTPEDNSTAALYQYNPVVGTGHTGMSLFANIWVEYARALSYATPASAAQGATSLVGDACLSAVDCAFTGALCATGAGYPGGMCTEKCSGSCAGVDAFCADFTAGGYCLAVCNPTDPASCRAGYSCTLVMPSGAPAGTAAENVCTPG